MTSKKTWTETTLDNAIKEVINEGVFDGPMLEARPVWHITGAILIAECRAGATPYWLVAGADSPTDIVPAHVADTAREAARHFSLKWQLAAEQLRSGAALPPPGTEPDDLAARVKHLVKCAESLMELVEHEPVWVT